jgi:hypothetical protein
MPKTIEIIAGTRIVIDDGGMEDLGPTNAASVLERLKKAGYSIVETPRKEGGEARAAKRAAAGSAPKAAELAAREIDQLGDKTATGEERASRKRRLIAGPKEFRGIGRK